MNTTKSTRKFICLLALTCVAALNVSPAARAQGNENRAIIERLERLERNANTRGAKSADGDGAAIMGNVGGDLQQQVFNLQEELRDLRGQIEKSQFENRTLKDKIERMEQDVDFRLNTLEKASATPSASVATPAPQPQAAAVVEEKKTPEKQAEKKPAAPVAEEKVIDTTTEASPSTHAASGKATTAGDGTLTTTPGTGDLPREHYNQAFRLMNQTRYDEAGDAFETFVNKYPDDPLIGNAYYWLGETHYIQRDYVKAADSFRQGFEVLPNGPKAPDNLLKLAMTLRSLNRNDDACTVLAQIKVKFKDSSTSLLDKAEQERTRIGCK